MNNKQLVFSIVLSSLLLQACFAQEKKFVERVLQNRYQLTVADGAFSGTAAPVLEKAISDSQFVLVGEDHGIAQVPAFVTAICRTAGPRAFRDMAVETGPMVADELQKWIFRNDGRDQLIAFGKQFPETIAFFNFQEEFDLLSACAHAAPAGTFHLWGVDQELMGSSGYIFTQILATHPAKEAADQTKLLLSKNDEAYAIAAKSGNPGDTYMMTASDEDLAKLHDLLQTQGTPQAQGMLASLVESRDIYKQFMKGSGYDSNRRRALLMKNNFMAKYRAYSASEGQPPRLLMKFGIEHIYKGFNPIRNNDLGNMVAELAESTGTRSVHILIVGAKGSQLHFAGIGRPFQDKAFNLVEDKDSEFRFVKPLFDQMGSEGWTMFDLRGLRKGFASLGPVDKELERMIFGNDLLIVIPNALASKQIQ